MKRELEIVTKTTTATLFASLGMLTYPSAAEGASMPNDRLAAPQVNAQAENIGNPKIDQRARYLTTQLARRILRLGYRQDATVNAGTAVDGSSWRQVSISLGGNGSKVSKAAGDYRFVLGAKVDDDQRLGPHEVRSIDMYAGSMRRASGYQWYLATASIDNIQPVFKSDTNADNRSYVGPWRVSFTSAYGADSPTASCYAINDTTFLPGMRLDARKLRHSGAAMNDIIDDASANQPTAPIEIPFGPVSYSS